MRCLNRQGTRLIDKAETQAGMWVRQSQSATSLKFRRCRPEGGWKAGRRGLREHEGIASGGEVNWLSDGSYGERLPAIDFAHVDLSGSKQGPEQHGRGLCRRQHGLGLDPPLELLV